MGLMSSRWSLLLVTLLAAAAQAQTPAPSPSASSPSADETKPEIVNSRLDGPLFYQLLLGELNVREGSPGAGFSLLLDAARRTKDARLFQRSVQVALQARSGDAALQAAQTWKKELPQDREPNALILQLMLALGRAEASGPALSTLLKELPPQEQGPAIASIPRAYAQVPDKALVLRAVEPVLRTWQALPGNAVVAWTTLGRLQRDAGQFEAAMRSAERAHALDPNASGPLLLAIGLMGAQPQAARTMLDAALARPDAAPAIVQAYAQALNQQGQPQAAMALLQNVNQRHPDEAGAWLLHGLLQHERGNDAQARPMLEKYLDLVHERPERDPGNARVDAIVTLALIALRERDLVRAQHWLDQAPPQADPLRVAAVRAQLLAQQGQLAQGRQVIASAPAKTEDEQARRLLMEAQFLREHRQAEAAYALLQEALTRSPDRYEWMTELTLVAAKLQRFEEMETLLRRMMAQRPDDPHAYNALGYSLADRGQRLPEARTLIEKAVSLAPNDPFIMDSLGWVAFREGQVAQALRILRRAFELRPDPEIAAHLGEVLWVSGQREEARAVWQQGLRLKADNETLQDTLRRLDPRR